MSNLNLPTSNMLVAYWIPSVGIGSGSTKQTVHVPLTDVLNYTRPNGDPQINAVHLTGATFTKSETFESPFLDFDPDLAKVLTDGSVQALQRAGIKVVLTIMGSGNVFGWHNIPSDKNESFANYLKLIILGTSGYGLDGIDIDDEYPGPKATQELIETVQTISGEIGPNKILSKALWADQDSIPGLKDYLTYGGIMYYGNDASLLEYYYGEYRKKGLRNDQILIGVNAGPSAQNGAFTSIDTTIGLTQWQPNDGVKLGMMVWTFCQDIQQFTADPQNQPSKAFPNPNDHEWQRTIINTMYPK